MRYPLVAVLLGALTVLPGAPARAQYDTRDPVATREGIALSNQIAELRRDLQDLREQISRGGGSSGGAYSALGGYRAAPAQAATGGSDLTAQLLQRVSELEDEVRRLHGRVDEADNARQRQSEDLQKQIADLNFKLDGAGGGAGSGGGGSGGGGLGGGTRPHSPPPPLLVPPAAPVPAAPGVPARRPAELALHEGNAALARRDYAAAEAAAREVLAGPKTPHLADANFLLAQAMAGRRDWARAAVAYGDAYDRGKPGPRAADALVGLAVSLTNLNDKKSACQALDKLRVEFPNPRPDLRDSAVAARQHAGCR